MKVLVFDTETTGLPEKNALILEHNRWPFIVQLSYILYDTESKTLLKTVNVIIKIPEHIAIPAECTALHSLTQEICQSKGEPLRPILECFLAIAQEADLLVGHNISFDKNMIMVECSRQGLIYDIMHTSRDYCTMKETKELVGKICIFNNTGRTFFKYPKLAELYSYLFTEAPKGMHDSMADILLCLRSYVKLQHNYDIAYDAGVDAKLQTLLTTYCL
jgi:DNA polymerase-3 subunit epsilon